MAKRRGRNQPDEDLEISDEEPESEVEDVEFPENEPDDEPESEVESEPEPPAETKDDREIEDDRPKIHLRVFLTLTKSRWDQMAGFQNYAIREKLGPMTVPKWGEAVEAFRNRPTKRS